LLCRKVGRRKIFFNAAIFSERFVTPLETSKSTTAAESFVTQLLQTTHFRLAGESG